MKKVILIICLCLALIGGAVSCNLLSDNPATNSTISTTQPIIPTTPSFPTIEPTIPTTLPFVPSPERPEFSTPSDARDILATHNIYLTYEFNADKTIFTLTIQWENTSDTPAVFSDKYLIIPTQNENFMPTNSQSPTSSLEAMSAPTPAGEYMIADLLFDMTDTNEICIHVMTGDGDAYIVLYAITPNAEG